MAGTGRSHINQLVNRDGGDCHYCKIPVRLDAGVYKKNKHIKDRATRDHIVPKSMGGLGTLKNFVLACAECNEKRGDNLYYCACAFCTGVVEDFMQRHFGGTFGPVKPRVWKHHDGTWVTSYGLNSYSWNNWNSAMRAVPSHERANA